MSFTLFMKIKVGVQLFTPKQDELNKAETNHELVVR